MNNISFKNSELIGDTQLIFLVIFIIILASIFFWLQFNKRDSLKVKSQLKLVGKTALNNRSIIYELKSEHKTYLIFESPSGVIELFGEDIKNKVEDFE